MLQLNGLSGKREGKESVEITPKVRVLNTNGALRLNASAIALLGVPSNGYVAVADAGGVIYIGAGKAHTISVDEQGNPIKTGSGKFKTEGDGYGSKLKPSSHAKPHGTFSASAAWQTLRTLSEQDDFDGVIELKLGEGVEATINTDNELYPEHVAMMYPLELLAIKPNESDDTEEDVKEEVTEEELKESNVESVEETGTQEVDEWDEE